MNTATSTRVAMMALLTCLMSMSALAQGADGEQRPPRENQPYVEILTGHEHDVCKAYEGLVNYANGPDGYSNPDYDAMPKAPGFKDFSVPEWGGILEAKFPEMVKWDLAQGLIGEYFWVHDVNLVRFIPFGEKDEYVWKPTLDNIEKAREGYWAGRRIARDMGLLNRAVVDINNDGTDDYVWRNDYPSGRSGSLVATNEDGDAIDAKLTALLRRHRGREELGLGYFYQMSPERKKRAVGREHELGIGKAGDAYSEARYHVFAFRQLNYFSLQWSDGEWAKPVAGEQFKKATVFKVSGDTVDAMCVMTLLY